MGTILNNKSQNIMKEKYIDLFFGSSLNDQMKTFCRRVTMGMGSHHKFPRFFSIFVCLSSCLYSRDGYFIGRKLVTTCVDYYFSNLATNSFLI